MEHIKLKLEIELAELQLKIYKAKRACNDGSLWDYEYNYPREVLGEQIEVMKQYASLLNQRIDLL